TAVGRAGEEPICGKSLEGLNIRLKCAPGGRVRTGDREFLVELQDRVHRAPNQTGQTRLPFPKFAIAALPGEFGSRPCAEDIQDHPSSWIINHRPVVKYR